jgi:histidine triad (HIT) family protein
MNTEPSIFTRIINREIPAVIIYEDDVCICILDIFPGIRGQSLVIPKLQESYIFHLDNETYHHLFMVAKKIALASDVALQTERTCLVVEGFEVPHVHIKIYPMPKENHHLSQALSSPTEATNAELEATGKIIMAALS